MPLSAVIIIQPRKLGHLGSVQPGLCGAMTTSFPAIIPDNGHTLMVSSTWAEAPQGV